MRFPRSCLTLSGGHFPVADKTRAGLAGDDGAGDVGKGPGAYETMSGRPHVLQWVSQGSFAALQFGQTRGDRPPPPYPCCA